MSKRRTLALAIHDLRQTTASLESAQLKLEKYVDGLQAQTDMQKFVKALTEAAREMTNGNLDSLVKVTGVMNKPQVTPAQLDHLVSLVNVLEEESDILAIQIAKFLKEEGAAA